MIPRPHPDALAPAEPEIRFTRVSVVVPVRNEASSIGRTVEAVLAQAPASVDVEVVVVDDGSTDDTRSSAVSAGAVVLRSSEPGRPGNPAAARNLGAAESRGDPIVFLDADCTPQHGWLEAILAAHSAGEVVVGGSLDMPPGLSPTARCDYYCGWYLIHSRRPAGHVPHHPPPNLSVRRNAFLSTAGFAEEPPFSYTNEERFWQAELRQRGDMIYFEPRATAWHHNRPGFLNLLKRNYRWAYAAVESKSRTGSARMAWLYRWPVLTILASGPLALAHTGYIVWCWMRAGVYEPLLMLPGILVSRVAYAAGMVVGGVRWLRRGNSHAPADQPRWT